LSDRIIFLGVAGLLLIAPLVSGSVNGKAYGFLEISTLLLLLLWMLHRLVLRKERAFAWVRTPVNGFLLGFLAFICLQLIPLPVEWIQLISPQTAADKRQMADMLAAAAGTQTPDPLWISLAYHPNSAIIDGIELVSAMGIFFLVLNAARSKEQIDALVYILLLTGAAKSVYAVYQLAFGGTGDVWRQRGADSLLLISVMTFSLALGMLISRRQRSNRVKSGLKGTRASFQRFLYHFSPESSRPRIILLAGIAVLTGATVITGVSPSGILAFGFALLTASGLLLCRKHLRSFGYGVLSIGILVCVLGFGRGTDTASVGPSNADGVRSQISLPDPGLAMARDYPVAGAGLGSFESLLPRYRPVMLPDGVNTAPNNGWLAAGAELGIIGGVIAVAGLVVFLIRFMRIWLRRRDYHALGVGVAAIMCLASIAAAVWTGCDLVNPGAVFPFAATMALGYLSIHRQGRGPSESFFYRQGSISLTVSRRMALAVLSFLIVGLLTILTGRHLVAEAYFPKTKGGEIGANQELDVTDIDRAIAWNPLNAEYHWVRASALRAVRWGGKGEAEGIRQKAEGRDGVGGSAFSVQSSETTDSRLGIGDQRSEVGGQRSEIRGRRSEIGGRRTEVRDQRSASLWTVRDEAEFIRVKSKMVVESLESAVRLNPANGAYWYELGRHYRLNSDDPYEYINKRLPLADECFDVALSNSPYDHSMLNNVGRYWVWRASVLEGAGEEQRGIEKFQSLFRRSLSLDAGLWKQVVDWVWEYYPDDAVVLECVPEENTELRSKILAYLIRKDTPPQ